jgi:uncharacterized protein YtpQ (UPF0354 family)
MAKLLLFSWKMVYLRMLNSEKIDRVLPEDFQDLLTQEEYEFILDTALASISKHTTVDLVKEGEIHTLDPQKEDSKMTFSLRNVVRKCKAVPREEWAELIDKYLGKPLFNEAKHMFLMKDFEYAEPLLKVVVRSKFAFDQIALDRLTYREDIPHTCTFLVLDYDDRFHYIDKTLLKDWEMPLETLFEIGLINVGKEDISVERVEMQGMEIFAFFSGDFSAPYIVELEKNAPQAVGALGAVVNIPSKGKALVHPLDGNTALQYIANILQLVEVFFSQDPGPINVRSYWYYEGKFEEFPMYSTNDGKQMLTYPDKLLALLTNASNDEL